MTYRILFAAGLILLFLSGCGNESSRVSENDQMENMSDACTANVDVYRIFHPVKTWSKDDAACPQQDPSEYVSDIFFGKFKQFVPDVENGNEHIVISPLADSRQVSSQIILVADR